MEKAVASLGSHLAFGCPLKVDIVADKMEPQISFEEFHQLLTRRMFDALASGVSEVRIPVAHSMALDFAAELSVLWRPCVLGFRVIYS